jgi:hypothetical protein
MSTAAGRIKAIANHFFSFKKELELQQLQLQQQQQPKKSNSHAGINCKKKKKISPKTFFSGFTCHTRASS